MQGGGAEVGPAPASYAAALEVAALAGDEARVVLVVRQANTTGEGIARAVARLREAGTEPAGVVMIVPDERAREAVWR